MIRILFFEILVAAICRLVIVNQLISASDVSKLEEAEQSTPFNKRKKRIMS